MPDYKAPIADHLFLLFDVLKIEQYQDLDGFSELSPDLAEAILVEAAKLCEETLLPLNQSGDQEGCKRGDDGSVTTPKGFSEAYQAYIEGGWNGIHASPDFGGQGLPYLIAAGINEMTCSANMSFSIYPGLTQGAISALMHFGSDEQKQLYLPKMVSGEWTGTMNLTEPHCGTDLGLIKTKATLQSDGSYQITGQKIFISSGEHDLANNIIHLVLARIEDAPEGIKGISMFVVPKMMIDKDGGLGAANQLSCGALEEKMGIHANATCVMNFDGASGWLVGEENKGLKAMFTMMNEARLGVGVQGLSQSEIAYQNAALYAKDRLQGRALAGAQYPDKPADPLIVHPDIRRILLDVKAFNEAARALILWTALHGDLADKSDDEAVRIKGDDVMGLFTPVVKGFLTDIGFDNCVKAQQVLGGHGYIEEWGMSQYVRDARIAMMYEGANGIQALDLVGRKLAANGGRAVMGFFADCAAFIKEHHDDDALDLSALKKGLDDLQASTMWFMKNAMAKPDNAGSGATDYMHCFGLVALGLMWGKMMVAAQECLNKNDQEKAQFYESKMVIGRYYMERIMPETALRRARIEKGSDVMMELTEDAF